MAESRASNTKNGVTISWGAEHRKADGELISRQTNIAPPVAPQCLTFRCLWAYMKAAWLYALVASYHARRVAYAESNRNKVILERYRTGEPSPKTMWQALHANIKLRCPLCRKYNVDPLLFDGGTK
jgi:hypothetical protein